MGNVELFYLCGTIPKVQCSECLLLWNQRMICCTCGHLLVESKAKDALSIPHNVIKKVRPRGARHGKTAAQNRAFRSQLKIGSTEEKCIAMDKLAQEDHSYRQSSEEFERYRKIGISHWTNRAEMHRWDFDQTSETAVTKMNRLRRESGEERPEPRGIRRPLHPAPHGGSGMNTGGADNYWKSIASELVEWAASKNRETWFGRLLIMILLLCCTQIVYGWYQSAATDGVCEQNTLARLIFSCVTSLISMSHVTLAQDVCPHHVIRASCAVFVLTSLRLSTLHSSSSLSSSFFFSWSSSSSSMWVGSEREVPCALPRMRSWVTLADNTPPTSYEPKIFEDNHISETIELFIQESSSDNKPSNLHDGEISDYTSGRVLFWPLFTQVREDPRP